MKIKYIIDIDKDLNNWFKARETKNFNINWGSLCSNSLISSLNDPDLKKYIYLKYYKPNIINNYKNWLEQNVDLAIIQRDLVEITDINIDNFQLSAIITTFPMSRMNFEQKYFYLPLRKDYLISIRTIYHELFHFIFYQNFNKNLSKRGINNNDRETIKEALTVILNGVLIPRGYPEDAGYSIHKNLRKKIYQLWLNSKSLEDIFDKITKAKSLEAFIKE